MLKVHAHSLALREATLQRERLGHCDMRVILDVAQCHIWLNDAQQEIDRLRRAMAGFASGPCSTIERAGYAEARKSYAVIAVGETAMARADEGDGARASSQAAMSVLRVTNLGTLVDALL